MVYKYQLYAHQVGNSPRGEQDQTALRPSFDSPSFVSDEPVELDRYRTDSSHSRLLSLSSEPDDGKNLFRHLSSASSRVFAKPQPGLWKNQMLVDRSLRTMAATTSIFAIIMIATVIVWLPGFFSRQDTQSTSVRSGEESCKTSEKKLLALHLFINVAGTMILGMSNTYQQLVTALDVHDIPSMLQKLGDCKVGTNSPWSINRKSKGKALAWFSWVLLISTSLPVHLLANSFVGLSYTFPATKVLYNPTTLKPANATVSFTPDFSCWSAFRTGEVWWSDYIPPSRLLDSDQTLQDYVESDIAGSVVMFESLDITISYDEELCSSLKGTATSLVQMEQEYNSTTAACVNGANIRCDDNPATQIPCRISVRMQAAITLAGALLIKAVYMIAWNLSMRGKHKSKCLTFGDAIAASALNRELQVPNECLVNAGDAYRKRVEHSCHKHCKSKEQSLTGDEIGHCQKCKKWNKTNMSAGLEHPIVATKYKKSLISNLGGNAVVQMVLLSFCSLAMLVVSLFTAVVSGINQHSFKAQCKDSATYRDTFNQTEYKECMKGAGENWEAVSGGWGGFNESVAIATLAPNEISSETQSFIIANGAQLIYSLLYLLVVYNLTLISMERDWGSLETARNRIRSTLYKGRGFYQSYFLQLPKQIILPIMVFSSLMHWLLGQAISTKEWVWYINGVPAVGLKPFEIAQYQVVYAAYPVWLSTALMVLMTSICWWAFTFSREGYIPQMYGSIRVCCAATVSLNNLPPEGIQWGDLGTGKRFRHAGFSEYEVDPVVPGELYCGEVDSENTGLDSKPISIAERGSQHEKED